MYVPTHKLKQHLFGARLCKTLYNTEVAPRKNTLIHHSKDHKNVYVIFAGTQKMAHWFNNFNLFLNNKGVHTGFKDFADQCQQELEEQIVQSFERTNTQKYDQIENVILISHSLGASALIILLYDELLRNTHNVFTFKKNLLDINIDIVMFGAPKSGDSNFKSNFNFLIRKYPNINIYRYSIEHDLVNHFPPLKEYQHVCDEIPMYEQKKLINIIHNHSLNNYITNLKKFILDQDINHYL